MSWNHVIAQGRVRDLLQKAIERKQVAHAYLFTGPEGIGKDALAMEFAKTLVCERQGIEACDTCAGCSRMHTLQHPDIKFLVALPVGKSEKQGDDPVAGLSDDQLDVVREQLQRKAHDPYHRVTIPRANFIKINSVRELKRDSALSSFAGGRKIYILSHADEMNTEASNSLLKTLEEPLEHTILLLTTSKKEQLLPTIISRCQLVQCDPIPEEDLRQALEVRDGVPADAARLAAELAGGSYTRARDLVFSDLVKIRGEVVEFLRAILGGQRLNLTGMVDRLAAEHDRPSLIEWLKQMQAWLRDTMLLPHDQGDLSTSEGQTMRSFAGKYPAANLIAAQQAVEAAIAHVDKNVYIHLALLHLAVALKQAIVHSGSHDIHA